VNVTGTDFVLIPCRTLETTERFYTDVLGLEAGARYGTDFGLEIETGDLTLAFIPAEKLGREFVASSAAIVLRVDDVATAKAELESRGVQFQTDVIDSGTCHQAYFADPDGNALGIHHIYKTS